MRTILALLLMLCASSARAHALAEIRVFERGRTVLYVHCSIEQMEFPNGSLHAACQRAQFDVPVHGGFHGEKLGAVQITAPEAASTFARCRLVEFDLFARDPLFGDLIFAVIDCRRH